METVIAVTIFSLCLGCILLFLPTGLLSLKQSEREIFAANLAQMSLEEYRNWPMAALQEFQAAPKLVYTAESDGNRFDVWLAARPETFAPESAVHLEVTVRWRDRSLRRELSDCRVAR